MSSPSSVIVCGDSLDVLKGLPADGFDSCVTDPPYGLSFMGKAWDCRVPRTDLWKEVYRTLKPGAFLLAFFGTRTYHRGVVQIEDAGFEIRDQLGWMYGSGFPKSMDVSKAIDSTLTTGGSSPSNLRKRAMGDAYIPHSKSGSDGFGEGRGGGFGADEDRDRTKDCGLTTDDAKKWQGWGTALKPAWEPIVLARKPLIGTVAENVLTHGTGGLNIDGCRVPMPEGETVHTPQSAPSNRKGEVGSDLGFSGNDDAAFKEAQRLSIERTNTLGRFPANVIHDGSEEVIDVLGESSRFFYCPKPAKSERGKDNNHPTVKPIELMRYLCRLVTPPGGTILDPFCGSGTTGIAANAEGFEFGGIELDPAFAELARKRISEAANR